VSNYLWVLKVFYVSEARRGEDLLTKPPGIYLTSTEMVMDQEGKEVGSSGVVYAERRAGMKV
jgi:hypothetical protein